jgi:heptosyltransferase-2
MTDSLGAADRRGARYLIVKLAAIGDVVMASTIVSAIRARDPDAHVTWLCGERVVELVRMFQGVDVVLSVDERSVLRGGAAARTVALARLWRTMAGRRFDLTLLAHADARYRALLLPVSTGRLRALEPRATARPLPVPGRYFGDEYARMLDLGEPPGPVVGHVPLAALRSVPGGSGRAGVVLVPGGARNVLRESALRRWPIERYREVAAQLLAAGHHVTLLGDSGDDWVRSAFDGLAVDHALGTHGLPESVALLGRTALVVTHDTGPLHLAVLAGAPVLALFGPTMPSQFLHPLAKGEALWGGVGLACRPCYDGREFNACANNLCIQEIGVSTVVERALALLAPPLGG